MTVRRRIVGKIQKRPHHHSADIETSTELAGEINLPQYTLPKSKRTVSGVQGNIQYSAKKAAPEK
mgnify:CR=1 FL=1